MAIPDRFIVKARSRDLTFLTGRFVGAGAANATKAAGTGRGLVLTRTGVGAHTLSLVDAWPFDQSATIQIHSATLKHVKVTPFNPTTKVWLIQVVTNADAASEMTTSDELQITVALSATGSSP